MAPLASWKLLFMPLDFGYKSNSNEYKWLHQRGSLKVCEEFATLPFLILLTINLFTMALLGIALAHFV
jgi:hypothetical protein